MGSRSSRSKIGGALVCWGVVLLASMLVLVLWLMVLRPSANVQPVAAPTQGMSAGESAKPSLPEDLGGGAWASSIPDPELVVSESAEARSNLELTTSKNAMAESSGTDLGLSPDQFYSGGGTVRVDAVFSSASGEFSAPTIVRVLSPGHTGRAIDVAWALDEERLVGTCTLELPISAESVVIEPQSQHLARWSPSRAALKLRDVSPGLVLAFAIDDLAETERIRYRISGIQPGDVPQNLTLSWISDDPCDVRCERRSLFSVAGGMSLRGVATNTEFYAVISCTGYAPITRHSSQLGRDALGRYELIAEMAPGWGRIVMLKGCLPSEDEGLVVEVNSVRQDFDGGEMVIPVLAPLVPAQAAIYGVDGGWTFDLLGVHDGIGVVVVDGAAPPLD